MLIKRIFLYNNLYSMITISSVVLPNLVFSDLSLQATPSSSHLLVVQPVEHGYFTRMIDEVILFRAAVIEK